MAFMVKQGLYYLSDVAIHNDIINCVTSDLKPQVVKLNGEVVESVGKFHALIAHLRLVPLVADSFNSPDMHVLEIKEEVQWRALIAQ